MATGREGDSTHLATDEPDGLPSEQRSRRWSRGCSSLRPPDVGLFRYQETATSFVLQRRGPREPKV